MSKPRDEEGLTERQRYWHDHLKCARERGQSLVAYAQEQGLRVKSLYHYTRLARGEVVAQGSKEARFVRISAPVVASVCRVHLANGIMVEWQGSPDEGTLCGWLRAASRAT